MSTWIQVKAIWADSPDDWAARIELFEQFEVGGTLQTDDPPSLSCYLYDRDKVEPLRQALSADGATVEVSEVEEEDWSIAWRKFFVPRRIGQHWLVRPAWEEAPLEPGDHEIVLDPGQAFGTGDHPTTRMCLELMEQVPLSGKDVADIGCGSGILSVGACRLGAKLVEAVDSDLASVDASRENAQRNGVEFQTYHGTGFDPLGDRTYDVVLSNIISAALIRLAPVAAERMRDGGFWIVSGIIQSNWPEVREAAERRGFRLETEQQEGEWIAAIFSR